jgi:hypothetical protein
LVLNALSAPVSFCPPKRAFCPLLSLLPHVSVLNTSIRR